MRALHLLLPLTFLCMVVLASAEPARPRKGATTAPPPAVSTTRGPNQPDAKAPTARAGVVPAPRNGQTAPAQPAAPSVGGRNQAAAKAPANRGGVWPGPQGNQQAPAPGKTAGKNPAAQYAPPTSAKAPTTDRPGWGQSTPRAPVAKAPAPNNSQRPQTDHGYAPAPQSQRGPSQPSARDDRGRDNDRSGPQHGYVPQRPQAPAHRPADWDQPYHGRYDGHWKYAPLLTMVVRAFLPSNPRLMGAAIVADNDTFLGVISRDEDDPDSITNPYGRFGSPWSPYSIWNPDTRYGSVDGKGSPWNPYATKPPKVYDGNEFRGYLTTNTNLYPRVDPQWLRSYLQLPRW